MSPHDYPHDIELGLLGADPLDCPRPLPCGCLAAHDPAHDLGDCLEAQADALAYAEDLRRGEPWRCPTCRNWCARCGRPTCHCGEHDFPLDTV